jgi:pyruvate-formate lyase-activating enzyme
MSLRVNPFLHVDADRVYNPLTDRTLVPADLLYGRFRQFVAGGEAGADLEREGWIVRGERDLSRQHRLKIVSLETLTTCNQKCYFCPVSIAPREDYGMDDALFDRIVEELGDYRSTLEAVFLQNYNEPTVDKRFVDSIRKLYSADLPVAVLSNGSGFTPAKVDAILEAQPLRYLCINLSTLDRERYQRDRGEDHLGVVLRNVEYMKDRPIAEQMRIVVLGTGNDTHQHDFEQIRDRFAGSRFEVTMNTVMDRAGWLDVGLKAEGPQRRLAGCDNVGSRPLQHLHINPKGQCVFCCEDYDEKYIVGDLTTSTLADVLAGEELARLRRWSYGLEDSPADFICRQCIFARHSEDEG